MYVIYALVDPRNQQVRYVGMTDNVYERFRQHVYSSDDNPAKAAWLQELREANAMVILQTLEQVEGLEQAKKREAYWIQHYHLLGARLTNKIIPLHQEIVYVRTCEVRPEVRLSARMTPDEQRAYVVKLWSTGISRRTILAQVRKYIPVEYVNLILDECEGGKAVPTGMLVTPSGVATAQEQRIINKFMVEGMNISQLVASEFTNSRGEPLTGGELFKQRSKEVQDVLRRYLNQEAS